MDFSEVRLITDRLQSDFKDFKGRGRIARLANPRIQLDSSRDAMIHKSQMAFPF